ncbi:hypothetical protein [Winogradskyella sp. A3E31]|uniref:hypothetical protein n=1 Tax=Winogradskyella sp. A3E31 TaxID=3349637 RepID=UPI00398AB3D7
MKKLSTLIIGFIIGLAAMYWYCNYYQQPQEEEVTIVKPKGVVTPAVAKGLNNNWTNKRKKAVDSAAGRPDNRSAWWSLEDIQDYIDYADNQAGELGYELDGLRVYLGVYPGNAPNGKADYQTMFIVPTGKKARPTDTSEGSFNLFNFSFQGGGGDDDISGADPLNGGNPGKPPSGGYGG